MLFIQSKKSVEQSKPNKDCLAQLQAKQSKKKKGQTQHYKMPSVSMRSAINRNKTKKRLNKEDLS